jgi:N-acetylglucosamine repressor
MGRKRAGNNKFLKQFNESMILDLIRTHRAISKAELSQITGLSPTAMGLITSSLAEKGYIHETGTGESTGGRRPVLLELKPNSFYTVGVDLDVSYVKIILIDITGSIIHECSFTMFEEAGAELVLQRVENSIENLLKQFCIPDEKLLGIGFSVPGMVDIGSQDIILAPNLGWENISVESYLTQLSRLPIYVENEAMASAICEEWVGCCKGLDNFVCINIRSGIGAGIFTGGRLYKGVGGSAGEVGHIVVDENGPKCGCDNYGCLETMASTHRIEERMQRLIRQGSLSSLNSCEQLDEIEIEAIVKAAREGDESAKGILMEAARYLGIAISILVNTLNPSKIVLGKDFIKYADLVINHIKSIVDRKALKAAASKVEITSSALGEKSSAMGAAIIPLKKLFGK